jgi:putative ABC transport system permease protein
MKRLIRRSDIRADAHTDVGEEIRFHLEMRAREFMEQGLSADEALRAARASFGDIAAIASEMETARAGRDRDRARRDWWRGTMLDVRHALRALRKRPLFAGASILTLALGIGATVTIFTVVNGVLLRPLPYANPNRLAMIWLHGDGVRAGERWPLSSGMYLELATQTNSFASLAAFRAWPLTLRENDETEQMNGARVTPSLFSTLGVHAATGRLLEPGDTVTGAPPVAVISAGLWDRRFGRAPSVVGRMVTLSGVRTMIVGVLPNGFGFPRGAELPSGLQFARRTDVWTPLAFSARDAQNYGTMNLAAVGRLKDGVGPPAGQKDVDVALDGILKRIGIQTRIGAQLLTLREQSAAPVRRGLLLVMSGVVVLLVIACFNVATLLIARTAERGRELAVRTALGARRGRVTRQLVTENLIVAVAGGAIGALFSVWGVRALLALVPGSLPRADDVQADWRVVAVGIGMSAAIGIGFGVLSAFANGATNLSTVLHGTTTRSSSGRRARLGRRTLVTVEVALSLVLTIVAGLLVSSFMKLERVTSGFDPREAVTASITLPVGDSFNPARDGAGWSRFFNALLTSLAAAPGVRAVGATSAIPLSGTVESGAFTVDGMPAPRPGQAPQTQYSVIDGDYFRAAGIRLVSGRAFDARDEANAPGVVVINETLARKYFASENPLGRSISTLFDFQGGPRQIVGVAEDVKQTSLGEDDVPSVYVPEAQMPYPFLALVVRSRLAEGAVVALIRRELRALDPSIALTDIRTLDTVFSESLARQRFNPVLIGMFAGAALFLSLLGLYGIVTLGVQQRRRELGVRMALGARPSNVRWLVLREGLMMTTLGVAAGLVLGAAAARSLGDLLFGVNPHHAGIYAACALAVAVTALGASYLPARRATLVEAAETLRTD